MVAVGSGDSKKYWAETVPSRNRKRSMQPGRLALFDLEVMLPDAVGTRIF